VLTAAVKELDAEIEDRVQEILELVQALNRIAYQLGL